jgi:hypothetical protein
MYAAVGWAIGILARAPGGNDCGLVTDHAGQTFLGQRGRSGRVTTMCSGTLKTRCTEDEGDQAASW